MQNHKNLEAIVFDNRFTRELPADPELLNVRRQVVQACYSRVTPTPVAHPQLIAYAPEVAELLGLSVEPADHPQFAQVFSGNRLLPGMDPFAMCYGGHQFGNWAGQLGDGRAINLGEVVGANDQRWMLQLKGAGPTPYSRTADGLAVLRSSVREFLCSEAMFHLGVPTTRALSLVLTGEQVVRDMFYDGNPRQEPGAVVCRVAPTFTRFGNFEIFAARNDIETLRRLVDYTIRNDFPHLGEPGAATYETWFHEICRTTADMIVHWMRVGFVHGVMNTDNMSVLGLTIDYGPYGWLDDYDPNWTPNTTDAGGRRYRFGHQPQIAQWNLMQLANAIYPLVGNAEPFQLGLQLYAEKFQEDWRTMMARKIGLEAFDPHTDQVLIEELLSILQLTETDMTIFFRRLASISVTEPMADLLPGKKDRSAVETPSEGDSVEHNSARLAEAYYLPNERTAEHEQRIRAWLRNYQARLSQDGIPDPIRRTRMNAVNPKYVLRNYLAQLAIDKAELGDPSMVATLLELLRKPYDEQPEREEFAVQRPDWARRRAGCSMLSCSS
ncbi:MAG: YdiU family protein [Planctomycetota bacterium]|nr:YdiU family protein [Planctomycetota bacterium]